MYEYVVGLPSGVGEQADTRSGKRCYGARENADGCELKRPNDRKATKAGFGLCAFRHAARLADEGHSLPGRDCRCKFSFIPVSVCHTGWEPRKRIVATEKREFEFQGH